MIQVLLPFLTAIALSAIAAYYSVQKMKEPVEEQPKKAKKKKTLDNSTKNSLKSFFKNEEYELISKKDIINMTGDFK